MDYLKLFEKSDLLLDSGANFRCWYYRQGGAIKLECETRHPMLFVLQGELKMRFKYNHCTVCAGNLVAIHVDELLEYSPAPESIVLGYRPPKRFQDCLDRSHEIYDTPFSEFVPITPSLQAWIDRLFEERAQGQEWSSEKAHEQRKELAHILTSYPRSMLGELSTAFAACALGDCEQCRQDKC